MRTLKEKFVFSCSLNKIFHFFSNETSQQLTKRRICAFSIQRGRQIDIIRVLVGVLEDGDNFMGRLIAGVFQLQVVIVMEPEIGRLQVQLRIAKAMVMLRLFTALGRTIAAMPAEKYKKRLLVCKMSTHSVSGHVLSHSRKSLFSPLTLLPFTRWRAQITAFPTAAVDANYDKRD